MCLSLFERYLNWQNSKNKKTQQQFFFLMFSNEIKKKLLFSFFIIRILLIKISFERAQKLKFMQRNGDEIIKIYQNY
jgi:hypothetical protein